MSHMFTVGVVCENQYVAATCPTCKFSMASTPRPKRPKSCRQAESDKLCKSSMIWATKRKGAEEQMWAFGLYAKNMNAAELKKAPDYDSICKFFDFLCFLLPHYPDGYVLTAQVQEYLESVIA